MLYDMQLFLSMFMIWSDQRWAFYNYKKAFAILKDLSENLKIPREFLSWIKKQMVGGFKYPCIFHYIKQLGKLLAQMEKVEISTGLTLTGVYGFPINPVILVYYLAECQDFQECVHVITVEAPV